MISKFSMCESTTPNNKKLLFFRPVQFKCNYSVEKDLTPEKKDELGIVYVELAIIFLLIMMLAMGSFRFDFSLHEQFALREAVQTAARAASMSPASNANLVAQEGFERSLNNAKIPDPNQFTMHVIYVPLPAGSTAVQVFASSPNKIFGVDFKYCVSASYLWEAAEAFETPPASSISTDPICFP